VKYEVTLKKLLRSSNNALVVEVRGKWILGKR